MRVLRVSHAGRDHAFRHRERALVAQGVDMTLVVPRSWSGDHPQPLPEEPFRIIELDVLRPGDPDRYSYVEPAALRQVVRMIRPDVLDLHEEPTSRATRQWLRVAGDLPVAMFTAQNLDQRFPPLVAQRERVALRRADALYPASRQAASVARGKGFGGIVEVLPLGFDDSIFASGRQSLDDSPIVLGLVGRMVPEKGVLDAVRVLEAVSAVRPARLHLVGSGPQVQQARRLATELGVAEALDLTERCTPEALAALYRRMHVVLAPSRGCGTWVERFARPVVEAQASGALVAGYDSGAIAELAGQAGVIVREGDVQGLARAVTRLVTDPQEYAWRRAAGAGAVPPFTWPEIACRQVELYRGILSGAHERLPLARSAVRRRELARVEFGLPARTPAGSRPFAMPMLRRPSVASRALAGVIDATGASLGAR